MKRNIFLYLIIGFTTTLIVMVVFSLISLKRMNDMIHYSTQVENTYQVLGKLRNLSDIITEAEAAVRGYVITKDSSYLFPMDSVRALYVDVLNDLRELNPGNSRRESRIAMLQSTIQLRLYMLESLKFAVGQEASPESILDNVTKGRNLMASFKNDLDLMEREEQELLHERFTQKERYQKLTPRTFRIVSGVVGLIFLISFTLIVKAMLDRFRFQQELQEQLLAIKQRNDELTQLAFAASHDLQEPVRKIRTFTDRLLIRQQDRLDEEGKMILSRVDYSAKKLQGMLEDISTFMSLQEENEKIQLTDTRKLWEEAIRDYANLIADTKAEIEISDLPWLELYPMQTKIMFKALLDNSLAYRKVDESPKIRISAKVVEGADLKIDHLPSLQKHYHAITIEDNGIGFDNAFKLKVFQLFRRLHTQEDRSGKGIGLAICQRVMANHNGAIDVFAEPGRGAAFTLYFPKD
ncbi:MAG TPA: CHASE3 domain-containing protein [Flavihumibacter sp.]